jgi:hypothetical protein
MRMDSHLALKVLHNVQENIVDIRPLMELDLDGIEVAKCIRDIELAVNATVQTLRRRLRSRLQAILFLCRGRFWRSYHGCGCRDGRSISGGMRGGCDGCDELRLCHLRGWLRRGGILESVVYRAIHRKSRARVSLCEDVKTEHVVIEGKDGLLDVRGYNSDLLGTRSTAAWPASGNIYETICLMREPKQL